MEASTTDQLRLVDVLVAERGASRSGSERDELMTADELADRLRMTRAWVYAETRLDHIPHLRLGRRVRYRRSTIEGWIATLEVGPEADDRRRVIR